MLVNTIKDEDEDEALVLLLNDLSECYFFCLTRQKFNLKAHQKRMIKFCNYENSIYCYLFAQNIKGADVQLLSEAVLCSGNITYIKFFYDNLEFDKTRYKDLMLFL